MNRSISAFIIFVIGILLLIGLIALQKDSRIEPTQIPQTQEDRDKTEIMSVVESFGRSQQEVSVLSPQAASDIEEEYGAYVSGDLLAEWKSDPENAPGRQTSNPYPDSIDITYVTRISDGAYLVQGELVERTSDGMLGDRTSVEMTVEKRDGQWRITSWTENETIAAPSKTTLKGKVICLPHKDTSGPITLECAYGLDADNGGNYALDLQAVSGSQPGIEILQVGTRAAVTGTVTPVEALSNDRWQTYDMEGIMRVESYQKL